MTVPGRVPLVLARGVLVLASASRGDQRAGSDALAADGDGTPIAHQLTIETRGAPIAARRWSAGLRSGWLPWRAG